MMLCGIYNNMLSEHEKETLNSMYNLSKQIEILFAGDQTNIKK